MKWIFTRDARIRECVRRVVSAFNDAQQRENVVIVNIGGRTTTNDLEV